MSKNYTAPMNIVNELFERSEEEGIACTTVTNGHVLVLKETALERLLLESKKDVKGRVIIFVRNQTS